MIPDAVTQWKDLLLRLAALTGRQAGRQDYADAAARMLAQLGGALREQREMWVSAVVALDCYPPQAAVRSPAGAVKAFATATPCRSSSAASHRERGRVVRVCVIGLYHSKGVIRMQRRLILKQLAAFAALSLARGRAGAQGQEPFVLLPNPRPVVRGKVEVVEFFHYGCPHCRAFDPLVRQWLEHAPPDLAFRHVPAIWGNAQLQGLARLFYTLEATGELARLNEQAFDAVQTQKLPLHTEIGAVEWVAKRGGHSVRFAEAWKSFGVQAKVQQADQLGRTLRIQAVPSVVIDGRYLTSASLAGSHENALRVTDELIVRARRDQGRS